MSWHKNKFLACLAVSGIFFGYLFSSISFSNDTSTLVLKDYKSTVRLNPSSALGWRDASIVQEVVGHGLGDYNLKQYDYVPDNTITYSDVSNSMQFTDWNIPANTAVHIREDIYMDGYGGTINLGENSQLFVDDNVTLTLRNVTVSSTKNGVGNPAIKLASTRSTLALDSVKLDIANDFYFDRGQLFVYNDVNFTGTNGFIYRSTVPSYIKSGANLKFNNGTTFDFRPSTTGTPGLLAKDLLIMDDATSKITFDGASLKTTLTGMRLTTGQVLFDNKVSLTSQAALKLLSNTTTVTSWIFGTWARVATWSPDGRYLAVGGNNTGGDLKVFRFTGTGLVQLTGCTKDYGSYVYGLSWSSDGKFLAAAGDGGLNDLTVYSFNGLSLTQLASKPFSSIAFSVSWSPDGKYIAAGGQGGLFVYRFDGLSLIQIYSDNLGGSNNGLAVDWRSDGKYLAVGSNSYFYLFSFDGTTFTQIKSTAFTSVYSVNWSSDGRFLAIAIQGSSLVYVYSFNGSNLTFVKSASISGPYSVSWNADGRYLAAGGAGTNDLTIYSFDGANLTTVVGQAFGTLVYGTAWSQDGRYIAVAGNNGSTDVVVYGLNYGPETQVQNISNSIVFGNSSLQPLSLSNKITSSYDLTVKLLSGANVSVDGILNIDNSQTNTNSVQFASDNSRFVLKDWKSKIRMNQSSALGWRDSSIVNKVTGYGLGDYNLKQYDYVPDNTITYSEVSNSMQFMDWNIPANTAVHIRENIYMDGYGGTINLGENSQLFVDDNVTLTLRNVTVSSSKNFLANPPIKLATPGSKLALDNVRLDIMNDFYFDCGQLFVHNDVKFTGTSAFIYRSCQPSFIKSGANLKFNNGTTFDFRPSTTGTPGLLAKDLLIMEDATSKITFDGASLKTTLTGMRLTKGQILFDNKVSLTSQSQFRLTGTGTWVYRSYGDSIGTVNWSPDGRFLAVGGQVPTSGYDLQIYSFNGINLSVSPIALAIYGAIMTVNWSPDGKFLAVGGYSPVSGYGIQIYAFNGSVLSPLTSAAYGDPGNSSILSVSWSPDGRFLAVGGEKATTGYGIQVYAFNGGVISLLTSVAYGDPFVASIYSLSWSPDGKFLAVGGEGGPTNEFLIYGFDGKALSLVTSADYGYGVYTAKWSPDGRSLAVGVYAPTSGYNVQVYRFDGARLSTYPVAAVVYGSNRVYTLDWSPDGRYLAAGGPYPAGDQLKIYKFTGGSLICVSSINVGDSATLIRLVNWRQDGNFLAVASNSNFLAGHNQVEVYTLRYSPETQAQDISNSIVFGNSALTPLSLSNKITSSYDCTIKLLSGANVSVDGILNIDNSQTNTNSVIFANDNARFELKDWRSKIRMNQSSALGWHDSSITQKVTGYGLGDYNLKQYDYVPDNTLTYSEFSNSMQYNDWNIPANTVIHIKENIYMDGYGGTINLGENSQLFVDDNVTLTLRNVTVSSSKNFAGNPAIKLVTPGSKLALDNVRLDVMNDFYFDRGQLFVHNDVKFTGTSAFIYRSCQPSYITSGAKLIFDTGTTFSFAPATFTVCPYTVSRTYTANNFISMADKTSKIIFNGSDFKTTLTGLRLTTGEVNFDNKVGLDSIATSSIAGFPAAAEGSAVTTGNGPRTSKWSPDGRFIAVVNNTATYLLQIFRFTGSGTPVIVGSTPLSLGSYTVSWSPDGKFLAIACASSSGPLQVFSFSGTGDPVLVGSTTTGNTPWQLDWSTDGKFIAVANYSSNTLQIFSFSGRGNPVLIGSVGTGVGPRSVKWSPDGRFLALVNYNTSALYVYSFTGSGNPTFVGQFSTAGGSYWVDWSPDGRFVAVANSTANSIQIFRFTGNGNPILVGSSSAGQATFSACWSPYGNFVAVVNYTAGTLQIFKFIGVGNPVLMGTIKSTINSPWSVDWSRDGRFLVVSNYGPDTIQVFRVNYINNTDTQATSNSIVFGNSVAGSASDINLKLLSGANVSVAGTLNYDNTQGYTIFSNDNSRFVLRDANAKIKMNPNTVIGWKERSMIKNLTGKGLGDYNLLNYDTTPPTDIIGYSEAPGELVYDNSNAINRQMYLSYGLPINNSNTVVYLKNRIRNDSNVLLSWVKQTSNAVNALNAPQTLLTRVNSNAILSWVKQTSNAAVALDNLVRWNSNAIVYLGIATNNNSNAIIKLNPDVVNNSNAILPLGGEITNNSNAVKFEADHFTAVNNGKFTALGGITGTTNVAGRGFLASPIDLQGGTLTLNSDMVLSNLTTVVSSGNFDLQGNAMIFGGDLTIPSNVAIKVVSSGVLDGQGNEFKNSIGAKLVVDNNVSLTLRNMNWTAAGSPQVEMRDASSKLTLQNLSTKFDRDYSFTQGQLFIQDDVFVTGTNKFSYVSTATSYVMQHSTLYLDKNTTFSYSPRVTSRHTRSERNLIKLLDNTSEIYFNECTLQLPDSGWQLTRGTIYFDNKVPVYAGTAQADSFEWGSGVVADNLEIGVLAGGWIDNFGYIYHNPGN